MSNPDEDDLPFTLQHVARRQYRGTIAKPVAEPLQRLLTRYGLANVQERTAWENALRSAAGESLARHCRPGRYRGGVLEVIVANSATLQEITFQKKRIVKKLAAQLPEFRLRDIRFRIGEIA